MKEESIKAGDTDAASLSKELETCDDELLATKESAEKFARQYILMLQSIHDYAVYMLDVNGLVTTWNSGAARMKGYSAGDIIGKHFSLFYTPEDKLAGKPEKLLKEALANGRVEDTDWRVRRDETRFWANEIITPMRSGKGDLLGFVEVTRDLTEQKSLEKARDTLFENLDIRDSEHDRALSAQIASAAETAKKLHASEQLFATAFHDSPLAILLMTKKDGLIRDANKAFSLLFGYPYEDLIGHARKEFGFVTSEEFQELGTKLSLHKRIHNERVQGLGKGGNPIDLLMCATLLPGEDEELILVMFVDITAQTYFEKELQEMDRKKNEFISKLSHELRNPLASILSSAEVLTMLAQEEGTEASPAHTREAAETITHQVKNMSRLLEDLLNLSRTLLNKIELRPKPTDLRTILRHAIETTEPAFKKHHIALHASLPDSAIELSLDPVRMEQVFVNLLNNAEKYSGEHTAVYVQLKKAGATAVTTIQDEGVGIPKASLSKIFGLFTQSAQKNMPREGLGIGLALAKEIVEAHGGTISAASEGEGKGSVFTVKLPLHSRN